ncbi:MAG: adenylosuccinate lyase, partial [Phototrophicales bacterium]
ILRRAGYPEPYEALKRLTRGRALTMEMLHAFIDELDVSPTVKEELRALTPETYTGLADRLARMV